MRGRVVLRSFGDLCVVLAALALLPVAVALVAREPAVAVSQAAACLGIAALGLGLRRLPGPRDLQPHEALAVTALVFVFSPLVMTGPLSVAGLAPLDALFEAVSAVTTTGLSTLASVEERPRTFLFGRAWMQWYGGLGIAVLCVAMLIRPGVASRRLGATSSEVTDFAGSARAHARRMLITYVALTALGTAAILLAGGGAFESLLYALAAISTGGFAPHDASLAALDGPLLQGAVILVCVAGAISLPLYHRFLRRGPGILLRDVELRALVLGGLGVAALVVLYAALEAGGVVWDRLTDHALLAFSAQTTAGFASTSVAELPAGAKAALVVSMVTGGSFGSTAGGMKLLRIVIALRVVQLTVVRIRTPAHAVVEPRLQGERVAPDEIERVLVVIGLYVTVILVSWLVFLGFGYNALDALFEVASAVGTVGLSAGITRPELEPLLKLVLCVDMLLGRLEVVAFLLVLSPGAWFGRKAG